MGELPDVQSVTTHALMTPLGALLAARPMLAGHMVAIVAGAVRDAAAKGELQPQVNGLLSGLQKSTEAIDCFGAVVCGMCSVLVWSWPKLSLSGCVQKQRLV